MSTKAHSLTASGRVVVLPRIDVRKNRRIRYERAQARLRERYERGQRAL